MLNVSLIARKRAPALALAALGALVPVGAAAGSSGAPRVLPAQGPVLTGRLLVALRTPADDTAVAKRRIATLVARTDASVKDEIPQLGLIAVRPAAGQTLGRTAAELAADPLVARVSPERAAYPRYAPNDPAFSSPDPTNTPNGDVPQWYLRKENFPVAWDTSRGGGVQVATVDTGIDGAHPDFVYGRIDRVAQSGLGTNDTDGHGTHVAGLACGHSNNGFGIASAGFDCGLIVEKASHPPDVLPPPLVHPQTWFTDTEIAGAIVDAANRGAEAINLSLGSNGGLGATQAAIDYAWSHGSIPVAAASNCGTSDQGFPARYVQQPGTGPDQFAGKGLVVTAAQYDGSRAQFSASVPADCPSGSVTGAGFGSGVSVAAFGDSSISTCGILSTWSSAATDSPICPGTASPLGDSRFAYLIGTSMATPQVAGLVALIRAAHPGLAPSDVVRAIKLSASGGGHFTDELGWGIINSGAALHEAKVVTDQVAPKSHVVSKRRSRARSFKLKIESSDSGGAGVQSVGVYVSKGHRKYHLLVTTTRSKVGFTGRRGVLYRFYSRATDKAGNVEAAPKSPDAVTRIAAR